MPIDAYLNLGGLEGESPVREAVDTYQDALTDDAELFLLTFAEAVGFDSFDFEYRSISSTRHFSVPGAVTRIPNRSPHAKASSIIAS